MYIKEYAVNVQYGVDMIVCVGESLVDVIDKDGVVSETVGGCPLNVALTTARLGSSTALFTKISSDSYGNMILEKLIDNCIMFDPQLCNCELPTLCSKAFIDHDGKAEYIFDWKQTVASNVTVAQLSNAFSVMTDIDFIMTGSLMLAFPTTREAVFSAIETINPRPVIFYDPNVRPAVIEDMEDFKEHMLQYAQKCEILKISEDDLSLVFPNLSVEAAIQELRKVCKLYLIVTHGEKGSSWYAPSFTVRVPSCPVETLVDTIGCGDVFSGAILAQLQKRKDNDKKSIEDISETEAKRILEFASMMAANNCTKQGCDPSVQTI